MHMPVRTSRQPSLDLRGLVRGIVVHDQMHIRAFRHMGINLFEKVEKLLGAVTFVTLADHGSRGDIKGSKQRRCAVADVGVGPSLCHAWHHRQNRLLTVQRLYLRFFIHTKYNCPVWGRQIQANNILNLVCEEWIG